MRIRTAIIGLVLFGQLSCSNDDFDITAFKDDSSITTLNGTWKVVSFEDFSTNSVEFKTHENSWSKDIIVTFDDTLDPNILSGKVATNSVHGEFEYIEPRQFILNNYVSTSVGQPDWANKFGNAVLDDNVTFKINRDKLRIYYDNNSKSVTLTRE